jgi:cell shape-determining protein MreC
MTSAQIDTIQALENENKILADEVKMKEELIPGLEKMIAYLQKVQEENKKLKEDLKFSEDKVRDLTHEVNDRVVIEDIADLFGLSDEGDEFDWESEIGGMILDNKKLKEENKKLKKKLRASVEEEEGEEWNGWYGED